jgi:hypothetical protein
MRDPDDPTDIANAFGAKVGVVTEPNEDPAYPLWEVTVDSKGGIKDTITHGSVLIAAITSPAPTPATRASCSPPACSRKRPTPAASPSSPR